MGLFRLIYTSARYQRCSDDQINEILNACKRNNPGKSITGMLIHTNRRFLQVVEGEEKDVKELYEKIKTDERHGGVNVRYASPIDERTFPDWHMAYKDVSSEDLHYSTNISHGDKELFQKMLDGESNSYTDRSMNLLKNFLAIA